jgi:REP element-mobilizing transposase RayT
MNYHQPLIPGEIYHLFSRAICNEKLFKCEENYLFFLRKCNEHTQPVADFYTYSLMPNHFHMLIRIKPREHLAEAYENLKGKPFIPLKTDISDFIMERFSNWLNSYTKSFNKVYNRKGGLFMDYLRRSKAIANKDFMTFAFYIHKNAVHHGLTQKIGEWPFDGYNSILSNEPTTLLREEMLALFGGREAFVKFHQQHVERK